MAYFHNQTFFCDEDIYFYCLKSNACMAKVVQAFRAETLAPQLIMKIFPAHKF